MKTLLQIVPQTPGETGGVGDYALSIARVLAAKFEIQTVFAAPNATSQTAADFPVRSFGPAPAAKSVAELADHVLLHYVNYGYQARGVPDWLPPFVREVRGENASRVTTIFHELYASSPPWRSAFWLQSRQKQIARSVARLSRRCIVSSPVTAEQLRRLDPAALVSIQPVPSNFGEPALSLAQISNRNLQRWAICGGAALLHRSLGSFVKIRKYIPRDLRPDELLVLGGRDSAEVRSVLKSFRDIEVTYRPEVAADVASDLLSKCSLGWLDYLDRKTVPLSVVLKSSSFAALAAHGIVPVFPWDGEKICLEDNCLPGPFFVRRNGQRLPSAGECPRVGMEFWTWYQQHSAVSNVAEKIARFLQEVP